MRVEEAQRDLRNAQQGLVAAVKAAYPVGSVVTVRIGNSTFRARVEGHNDFWWSEPGEMFGVNLKTGKRRHFTSHQIAKADSERGG
ncbi:MAG: hypothetical protein RLN67_13830 [Algiphilus sp.]|uniref:hypothetical protein n=1 Tax=Algiphilus sp. TaxID=1872431 RepID=UPI0032EF9CE1